MVTGTLGTPAPTRTRGDRPELRIGSAALRVLDRLRAEAGDIVLLVSPDVRGEVLCFGRDDITVGPHDLLVATVRGCPVYVDRRAADLVDLTTAVLDVERDLRGVRFVLRHPGARM